MCGVWDRHAIPISTDGFHRRPFARARERECARERLRKLFEGVISGEEMAALMQVGWIQKVGKWL